MRRIIGAIIILTCLAILIHDAGSGRMSVFRDLYHAEDLNEQLRQLSDTDWPSAVILVRRGADPDLDVSAYGCKGLTPLHLAAGRGDIGAAQLLLSSCCGKVVAGFMPARFVVRRPKNAGESLRLQSPVLSRAFRNRNYLAKAQT